MVNGEDVDLVSLVLETPAGAARRRVPSANGLDAANNGEVGHLALRVPVVACDQAILAV